MESSLSKRYIIKLFSNFITGIINVALITLVPKSLGVVSFGHFSYIQQFFAQFIAFLDSSTSIAFFTKLSANRTRKELIFFYFHIVCLLLAVLYLLVFSLEQFNLLEKFLPSIPTNYIYLGLWFGFFTWLTQVYIKISDAYALTVSVELIKVVHKISSLLLLIYIIYSFSFDLNTYFYFHYISLISFLLIVSYLFIKEDIFSRELFLIKLKYRDLIKEFFEFVSPLFVFNTIAISVSLFDIWLLQKVSGSIQTGYYGLAYSIAAMCFLFTSAMTPIITREFAKYHAKNDMETVKRLFKKYVPMLYAIAAYFAIFISFQSENILAIFTSDEFKDVMFVLIIMAFFPIHQTYGQLNSSLFFATGKTKIYSQIGIFISLFGLIFSYVFVVYFELGAVGFAWKMVLVQIISVNVQLYFNVKFLNFKILPFILHQIYTILFFTILAYICYLIPSFSYTLWIDFLFKGAVYTLLVILGVIFIPKVFSVTREELFEFTEKLKKRLSR